MMEENRHDQEIKEAEIEDAPKNKDSKDKKIKNLVSLAILLGGLFIGSLFIDVVQLIKGEGISQRTLNKTDIFALEGKTWVAYNEPLVTLQVITDEECEKCNPDEALVSLRRMLPTILVQKVDTKSEEGKKMEQDFGIKTIPAFVFSKELEKTNLFGQAKSVFEEKSGQYVLNNLAVGIPAGKYLEYPKIGENDIRTGAADAKVKIIEFSDFQCPFSKAFHATAKKVLEEYKDKVLFVYKHLPLDFHPQSKNAALASECANEQGKFLGYADKLFENQSTWGKTEGTQSFKDYAKQLGLNTSQFNSCLDDQKYKEKVEQNKKEAEEFGISGTPAIFVNDQFENGAISFDKIKETIDSELGK